MWNMEGEGVCSGSTVSCTVKIYRSFSVLTKTSSLCFFSYQLRVRRAFGDVDGPHPRYDSGHGDAGMWQRRPIHNVSVL